MTSLRERVAGFQNIRVLLVGDTIVDLHTDATALGLSLETPTIVARRSSTSRTLGGAAFVCRNLCELGARVDFITAVGEDDDAINPSNFGLPALDLIAISDPGRPATVKHRYWVDGYKLLQLESGDNIPIGDAAAAKAMTAFRDRLTKADVVVISDYRHGLIDANMAAALVKSATAADKPVYVDSQVAQTISNHTDYRPGAILCLNLKEARCVDPSFEPSTRPTAFAELQRRLAAKALIVKLGDRGAILFDGEAVTSAAAQPVDVVDTTGAGDAFLACLALAGLGDPQGALTLANAWAALSTQKRGTATPELSAFLGLLADLDKRPSGPRKA